MMAKLKKAITSPNFFYTPFLFLIEVQQKLYHLTRKLQESRKIRPNAFKGFVTYREENTKLGDIVQVQFGNAKVLAYNFFKTLIIIEWFTHEFSKHYHYPGIISMDIIAWDFPPYTSFIQEHWIPSLRVGVIN